MERHNRITPAYTPTFRDQPPPLPPIPSYLRPPPPPPETPRRLILRAGDTELSIFDAERYFNDMEKCEVSTNPRFSSVSSVDGFGKSYRNGYVTTPIASSEASWNSQTGLLSNPPGSLAIKLRGSFSSKEKPKTPPSPRRRLFSRSCPCVGKKSVGVEEKYSEPPKSPIPICPNSDTDISSVFKKQSKETEDDGAFSSVIPMEEVTKVKITPGTRNKGEDFIHSSVLFPPKQTHTIAKPVAFSFPTVSKPIKTPSLETPRDSLEVFGQATPARITVKADEEQLSDTSSDLFELESFTANSYGASYGGGRRRDSFDDLLDPRRLAPAGFRRSADEPAPSECCYPPSEASVQWSVTTAEGFDRSSVANFSSAASDFDEVRFMQAEQDRFAKRKAAIGGGGGLLLSCRGDKAVEVKYGSGSAVRMSEPERIHCHSARMNRSVHMR